MKKYKLHTDESKVSDQEIDGYKDFGQFKAKYEEVTKERHKIPLYKNKKLLLAFLMLLMIIWVLLRNENKKVTAPQKTTTEQVD